MLAVSPSADPGPFAGIPALRGDRRALPGPARRSDRSTVFRDSRWGRRDSDADPLDAIARPGQGVLLHARPRGGNAAATRRCGRSSPARSRGFRQPGRYGMAREQLALGFVGCGGIATAVAWLVRLNPGHPHRGLHESGARRSGGLREEVPRPTGVHRPRRPRRRPERAGLVRRLAPRRARPAAARGHRHRASPCCARSRSPRRSRTASTSAAGPGRPALRSR